MEISDGLTIVTLVVASISMILSSIALWPRSREALSFVRDVTLWVIFLFVFVGAATLGWRQYRLANRDFENAVQTEHWPGEPKVIEANYVPPRPMPSPYWDRNSP